MLAPTSVEELIFIPNLASLMKPMNDLLKKDVEWSWGPAQEEALERVKLSLSGLNTNVL